MPITSGRVHEKHPKLGGGGPGKIPAHRGYGGDDEGDSGRPEDFCSGQERLRRYRVGVALFSICVMLLFAGIASAYIVRQQMGPWDPIRGAAISTWQPIILPYRQLWINSLLLMASSLTLEMARRSLSTKAEFATMGIFPPRFKAEFPWLGVTVLLGLGFITGQLLVWSTLRRQGIHLGGAASGSFFYAFTGLHAVHLLGGIAVLLYALLGEWIKRKFESQQIAIDATSWYWHFMALLWFALFALLHFARG
jgi:cytochrome c oxidase subunit III